MGRLPFDPEKSAGPPGPPESPKNPPPARSDRKRGGKDTNAKELTVSQLSSLIQRTLEERIQSPIRVIGEISNLIVRNHWYFSLKDENAVIGCVAWVSTAKKFKFTPADGQEVVATGHVSHYGPQGRTQFYVSKLEPVGAGALELRYKEMCEELRGLGYFDDARKKPLPTFPRCIAVITSKTSAAVQDVIATAKQRCPAVRLIIADVRVQGEGARNEVARAIKKVNRHRKKLGVDAILVTRGGGSVEDLWEFNERVVADAVFKSQLPIIAAIGHESDTTIIELVADLRAATPTQAAMKLIPSSAELLQQVGHLQHRLSNLVTRITNQQRRDLERLCADLHRSCQFRFKHEHVLIEKYARRVEEIRPIRITSRRRERVSVLQERLRHAIYDRTDRRGEYAYFRKLLNASIHRSISKQKKALSAHEHALKAMEVTSVLKRGFSYTVDRYGEIIRSVGDVSTGDAMTTHVADGTIRSTVGGSAARKPSRRKSTANQDKSTQLDLFSTSE